MVSRSVFGMLLAALWPASLQYRFRNTLLLPLLVLLGRILFLGHANVKIVEICSRRDRAERASWHTLDTTSVMSHLLCDKPG